MDIKMSLPKQVQEQAAQVERMMAEMQGNTATNATPSEKREEQLDAFPSEKLQAEQQAQPDVNLSVSHDAQRQEKHEVILDGSHNVTHDASQVDWHQRALKAEQKYQVLQGKYNAEIAGAKNGGNAELDQLRGHVRQLEATIAELREKPAMPTAADVANLDLDQLRDDYGSELIDGLVAAARSAVMADVQNVQREVRSDTFATRQELLANKLASSQINFQQVNNDPLFHEWLSKFDPETGVQRQQRLTNSFNAGQLDATAQMFIEFVQGTGTQHNHNATPFAQHVQPHTTAAATDSLPQPKPRYTQDQIGRFYQDWAMGKYTADEAQRIEREIFSSLS